MHLHRAARERRDSRGVTLVEILVVLALVGLMMVLVVGGSGQTSSARLRQSSALVTGGVRVGYAQASAHSKPMRLVFDLTADTVGLEESEDVMLLAKNDPSGTGGAEPMNDMERQALEESSRILAGPQAPRASFHPVEVKGFGTSVPGKGVKKLARGIHFKSVQTEHDLEPRVEGRAYLYFWPGGQSERASIQLRIGTSEDPTDVMTLLVSPLTGKVVLRAGIHDLVSPEDEREASEREEPGGSL